MARRDPAWVSVAGGSAGAMLCALLAVAAELGPERLSGLPPVGTGPIAAALTGALLGAVGGVALVTVARLVPMAPRASRRGHRARAPTRPSVDPTMRGDG
jgi:hypothetical protein